MQSVQGVSKDWGVDFSTGRQPGARFGPNHVLEDFEKHAKNMHFSQEGNPRPDLDFSGSVCPQRVHISTCLAEKRVFGHFHKHAKNHAKKHAFFTGRQSEARFGLSGVGLSLEGP